MCSVRPRKNHYETVYKSLEEGREWTWNLRAAVVFWNSVVSRLTQPCNLNLDLLFQPSRLLLPFLFSSNFSSSEKSTIPRKKKIHPVPGPLAKQPLSLLLLTLSHDQAHTHLPTLLDYDMSADRDHVYIPTVPLFLVQCPPRLSAWKRPAILELHCRTE